MITKWTQHLDTDEDKNKFEKTLRASSHILERLYDILQDMENSLNREEASPRAYDAPNWDYRQAHSNGFKQCLRNIKTLITLDQEQK